MDLNRPALPLQNKARNRKALAATAIAAALFLSACGGGAAPQGAEKAAAADPASGANASGAVNICGVKDASGIYKGTAEAFTKANGKVTAKYTEIGATTDEARTQIVQRLEGKSTECDLFVGCHLDLRVRLAGLAAGPDQVGGSQQGPAHSVHCGNHQV